MTVELSIALPLLLVEAAAVGAAELIRTARGILCSTKTRSYFPISSLKWCHGDRELDPAATDVEGSGSDALKSGN